MKLTILFLFISICSFAQKKGVDSTAFKAVQKTLKSKGIIVATTESAVKDSITVVFPKSVQDDLDAIEKDVQFLQTQLKQETEKRAKILNALYGGQGIDPMMLEGAPKYSPGLLKFKRKK